MSDYVPSLVKEHEVRSFFTPPLSYDDVDKQELLEKIEVVEDYIKAVYFNDSMPSRDDAKVPALLLVASKIIKNPRIAKNYEVITQEKLGDYSYKIENLARGKHKSATEVAKSWEDMALEILKARSTNRWQIKKAND